MTESDIEEMCEKYEVTNPTALFYYCDNFHINYNNIDKEVVDNFNDAFIGIFDSVDDYAFEIASGTGMLLGPNGKNSSFIEQYFDTKKFARDLVMGGDIWVEEDHDGVYIYYNV
jgi:antirestriction protein